MDLGLGGKVAVVTGASKGIGLAVTRMLADEGALVVAGARSIDTLAGIEGVSAVAVDLVQAGGSGAARRPMRSTGTGRSTCSSTTWAASSCASTGSCRRATLISRRRCSSISSRRCGRLAPRSQPCSNGGQGAIVNVVSVNAFFQPDGLVIDYGAAKAALLNVSKALSQELGPQGHPHQLRLARPGRDRPLARRRRRCGDRRPRPPASIRPPCASRPSAGIPSGRFTTPEEVATLVVMLASPRTANVTGANYVIDGGLIKTT